MQQLRRFAPACRLNIFSHEKFELQRRFLLSQTPCSRETSTSASEFKTALRAAFKQDAEKAAQALSEELALHEKAEVINAIHSSKLMAHPLSQRYVQDLFERSDKDMDGNLSQYVPSEERARTDGAVRVKREELGVALATHQVLGDDHRIDAPTREQQARVFVANSLPFIGFGFLDNLIMIMAGDYIDMTLGSALCLSTMAAAGLGNMISDVAGIFCADWIEARAQVLKWGRMPSLSKAQMKLPVIHLIPLVIFLLFLMMS